MLKHCAIDGGNSTIDIVIDGEKYPRIFPSIQSDPLPAKANYNNAIYSRNMDNQLYNKLHVETTMHVDKNGKDVQSLRSEFLFGKMAEEYQKDLRTRPNKDKYQDKSLAKWMLTALAFALLENKMQDEKYVITQNNNLQFNVIISTGLPYREGVDDAKRLEWANMFKGVHKINFKHPIFQNLTVDLVVEDAVVWIEGEMALNMELNKNGGIYLSSKPEELLNKKMAMIDIGGHTTELVTIAYELYQNDGFDEYSVDLTKEIMVQPVTKAHLTDGIQRGVKTIMEDVITEVEESYRNNIGRPLKRLTSRDIELSFTNKGRHNGEIGWIIPEMIDVKPAFIRQCQNLAMDIAQKIHTLYQEYTISEVDTIFICGGGSRIEALVSVIKSELEVLGFNGKKIISVADPMFANVKGYYLAMTQCFENVPELVE